VRIAVCVCVFVSITEEKRACVWVGLDSKSLTDVMQITWGAKVEYYCKKVMQKISVFSTFNCSNQSANKKH